MVPVALSAAAIVLIGAWILALRAQIRRSDSAGREWRGEHRPHLWTSQARCLQCGQGGGVIDEHDGELSFTCLRCGHHRTRRTRG